MVAVLTPFPKFTALDSNGDPLAGGKLYSFEPGTSTPKALYSASDGLTPLSNPVVLDSAGQAEVWLSGKYKLQLDDSSDVQQWAIDNVGQIGDASEQVYTPAGTGAVDTTVQAALRQWPSVKDFGATGDGVTDDRAAFALAEAAGPYIIPAGTYVIGSDITLAESLIFLPDAMLSPSTSITVTLSGTVHAGIAQIFTGAGTITFNSALTLDRLYPQWWGATGDGVTDDTTAMQNAIEAAEAIQGLLWLPNGDYAVTSTLSITTQTGMRIDSDQTATITGTLGSGNYVLELNRTIYVDVHVWINASDCNGIKLIADGTSGADTCLHNTVRAIVIGPGKAGSRPADPASGSIGIHLGYESTANGNFFNNIWPEKVRNCDCAVLIDRGANGNFIYKPQVEVHWWGIALYGIENHVFGGFAHFSSGNSSSEEVIALYVGDGANNATFNTVIGYTSEQGSNTRAVVLNSPCSNNFFHVHNNEPLSNQYNGLTSNLLYERNRALLYGINLGDGAGEPGLFAGTDDPVNIAQVTFNESINKTCSDDSTVAFAFDFGGYAAATIIGRVVNDSNGAMVSQYKLELALSGTGGADSTLSVTEIHDGSSGSFQTQASSFTVSANPDFTEATIQYAADHGSNTVDHVVHLHVISSTFNFTVS